MDKTFDPQHLDIKAFAQAGAQLHGETPLADCPRLLEEQFVRDADSVKVRWQIQGRMAPVTGGAPQVSLRLHAEVSLARQCQRCLTPVMEVVVAENAFIFVADEATAEVLDEDSETDVLVVSRDFDVLSLLEDELILALPLVPRHDVCPEDLPKECVDEAFESAADQPHPFAVLATLKRNLD